VESYEASEISQSFDKDFQAVQQRGLVIGPGAGDPLYSYLIARGQDRVGFVQQFLILSSRAFKNLYRNPMLMLSHYLLAILLAGKQAPVFPQQSGNTKTCSYWMFLFFLQWQGYVHHSSTE
jgi:hypothetical protein